jgi:hypothetical protein
LYLEHVLVEPWIAIYHSRFLLVEMLKLRGEEAASMK